MVTDGDAPCQAVHRKAAEVLDSQERELPSSLAGQKWTVAVVLAPVTASALAVAAMAKDPDALLLRDTRNFRSPVEPPGATLPL